MAQSYPEMYSAASHIGILHAFRILIQVSAYYFHLVPSEHVSRVYIHHAAIHWGVLQANFIVLESDQSAPAIDPRQL